jgi:ATP synthase I subunit
VDAELPPNSVAEHFYEGAIRRIVRILLVLAVITPWPVWWLYGRGPAAGFFLGALISWVNFKALARSVEALASRIVEAQSRERGGTVVLRFLLRYVLVGIVAYAIFRGSLQAFRGFLFGLCLLVGAMLCEAAWEAYAALRRGY